MGREADGGPLDVEDSLHAVVVVQDGDAGRLLQALRSQAHDPGIGAHRHRSHAPEELVADCIATVIYDPKRRALMLAHLGRHSTVARLMSRAVRYFVERGSQAKDLQIWMSPSITQKNYRMDYFNHTNDTNWQNFCRQTADGIYLDMQGFNRSLAVQAGVPGDNIVISPIDTADDPNYFSHSAGDTGGRFAVLAEIKSTK